MAYGTAAGPEGAGGAGVRAVGVVMQQDAEAAHQAGGERLVVVAAEHCRQLRIDGEMGPEAIKSIGMNFHIGIHKHQ